MYVMKLKYLIAPFLLAAAALCGCQETAEIHPVAYMTDAQKTVSKSVTIDTPPAGTEISVSSSVPVNKDTKIKISLYDWCQRGCMQRIVVHVGAAGTCQVQQYRPAGEV